MNTGKRTYGQGRTEELKARVKPETKLEMMKRADLTGCTVSDYCNRLFEKHCKTQKK